ncbi:MAG: DUF3100 domain-containing protein [Oceanicaulis sp.]
MTLPPAGLLVRRCALFAALALCVVVAELIGTQSIDTGPATIVLLPLLFAFLAGLILNPNVTAPMKRVLSRGDVRAAGRLVAVAVMPLMALLSMYIGPELSQIWRASPALLLQEFGNLGTMLVSLPVAVLVFRMRREAIGATFSIAREGGLAYIFSTYGGRSAEARGVTGVYICGTLFGTIFFSLTPGLILSIVELDIRAAAMACGVGSASMTAACAASLTTLAPDQEALIGALAASSNLISGLTTLFMVVFITIPLAEAYYARLERLMGRAPT